MSDAVNLKSVFVAAAIAISATIAVVLLVVNPQPKTLCPVSTETPQENLSARLVDDVSTKSLKHNDSLIATIYLITPTYVRTTQKVDLTSLCYTFMHVPNLVWIVVEDAEQRTALVANLLSRCDLQYVHLNVSTSRKRGVEQSSVTTPRNISSRGVEQSNVTTPRRYLSKGVEQRNVGLLWLRKHCAFDSCNGVVYFADDDNTYDLRLFEMIRGTQVVSVHPVGFVAGLKFEGPLCENGKAVKWHVAWGASRTIPLDMAGFAINLKQLLEKPTVVFGWDIHGNQSRHGYLETDFLENFVTRDTAECRASRTEVYVWHTKTLHPQLVSEGYHSSDLTMEIR